MPNARYFPGEWLNVCAEDHSLAGSRHRNCPAPALATWLKRRGYPTAVRKGAIKTDAPGDVVFEAQLVWEDRH